jgi:hypothetical protein
MLNPVLDPVAVFGGLTRVFNVHMYGARGDGTTDDSAAIQLAANVANQSGGGTVLFTGKTYLLASRVSFAGMRNVKFVGEHGATTLRASGSRTSIFSTFPEPSVAPLRAPEAGWIAEDIEFSGITFDMDYDVNPDGGAANARHGTPPHAYAHDNYQYAIYAYRVRRLRVAGCTFLNSWYPGLGALGASDVWVVDNRFEHVCDKKTYLGHYGAIELDSATRQVLVAHNHLKHVGGAIAMWSATGNRNDDGQEGAMQSIIAHNTIERTTSDAIVLFGYRDCVSVTGNLIRNVARCGICVTWTPGSTSLGAHRVKVEDNIIEVYNTDDIDGLPGIDVSCGDFSVCRNFVRNTLGSSPRARYGIITRQLTEQRRGVDTEANYGIVVGNIVRGSFENGYGILASAKYTHVSDNLVVSEVGTAIAGVSATAQGASDWHNRVIGAIASPAVGNGRGVTTAVSPDRGDKDVRLTVGIDSPVQRFATRLTMNRSVILSSAGASNGDRFRIVRTGLGAFSLEVVGAKTIPARTAAFVDVEFDGTAWRLTGYGTL